MPRSFRNRVSNQKTGELERQYHILPSPRFTRRVMGDDRVIPGAALSSDRGDFFAATDDILADSAQGIVSLWFRNSVSGSARELIANETNNSVVQLAGAPMYLSALLRNTSAGISISMTSSGDPTNGEIIPGNFYHALLSWNTTSDDLQYHMYLNDINVRSTGTLATGTINWDLDGASNGHWFGSFGGGSLPMTGNLAEVYVNVNHFLDLSVVANRRLFITASLRPVKLGRDGSKPTATQPDVYLSGRGQKMFVNRGSGGALTTMGGSPKNNLIAI